MLNFNIAAYPPHLRVCFSIQSILGSAAYDAHRISPPPRAPRASRKRRLKRGERFYAGGAKPVGGIEPDCNSLRYYTRSLNSK